MHTIPSDNTIIQYFLRNSHGIRGTAYHFGLSKIYVGRIVNQYLKKHRF